MFYCFLYSEYLIRSPMQSLSSVGTCVFAELSRSSVPAAGGACAERGAGRLTSARMWVPWVMRVLLTHDPLGGRFKERFINPVLFLL